MGCQNREVNTDTVSLRQGARGGGVGSEVVDSIRRQVQHLSIDRQLQTPSSTRALGQLSNRTWKGNEQVPVTGASWSPPTYPGRWALLSSLYPRTPRPSEGK